MREYAKLTREWVAKWPDSGAAWGTRVLWIASVPGSTKQELEQAGERQLELYKENEFGWSYIPAEMRVAQPWARAGIRLEDSLRMAQEALDEILLGPGEESDLNYSPEKIAEIRKADQFGFAVSVWDCMTTVVDAADQLRDFEKAHAMLRRMQQWLRSNDFKKDDSATGFALFEARYLQSSAQNAESEGRNLDAMALYVKALACCGVAEPEVRQHARQLWDNLGGTKDG